MRWTKRGAHLLLQARVQTLNRDMLRNTFHSLECFFTYESSHRDYGSLKTAFCRWYPEMVTAGTEWEALPLAA